MFILQLADLGGHRRPIINQLQDLQIELVNLRPQVTKDWRTCCGSPSWLRICAAACEASSEGVVRNLRR
jgi:hypothetical protein